MNLTLTLPVNLETLKLKQSKTKYFRKFSQSAEEVFDFSNKNVLHLNISWHNQGQFLKPYYCELLAGCSVGFISSLIMFLWTVDTGTLNFLSVVGTVQ